MRLRTPIGRCGAALGWSRRLAYAVLAAYLLTVLAIALLDVAAGWRLGLALLASASLIHVWRHDVARSARTAIVAISRDAHGRWVLDTRGGAPLRARPAPRSLVHPWLSLVVWRGEAGERLYLIVCPDALEAGAYRAVRVALRSREPVAGGP